MKDNYTIVMQRHIYKKKIYKKEKKIPDNPPEWYLLPH